METVLHTNEQNRDLVERLVSAQVRLLVVGGTALRFHAPERPIGSDDLDLLLEPTPENAGRCSAVLQSVGFIVQASGLEQRQKGFPLKTHGYFADFLTAPNGFDFEEHWQASTEAAFAGSFLPVRVASPQALRFLIERVPASERTKKWKADVELLLRLLEPSAFPTPRRI